MRLINCLIVDDEPLARELLIGFCGHLRNLHIAGVYGNALDAKQHLEEQQIELVFLDINMPVLDGIGLLNTLTQRPEVIITTAYKEFAVNAYDLAVCDYLIKPFSLERFIIAVDRVATRIGKAKCVFEQEIGQEEFIFIKTEGKIYRIEFNSLLFAEANGNHTKIFTLEHMLAPAMPFSSLEKMLPVNRFIKVHRSFIISKAKITRIEGNRVFINKHEIPIGKNYKDDFIKGLKI